MSANESRWHHRKYMALLIALGMLFLLHPMLRGPFDTRLTFDVFLTIVFLAALQAVFTARHLRLAALLLGIPTIVGAWLGHVLPGLPRLPVAVGFHLAAMLFLGLTAVVILREILKQETVSLDSILGALSAYLLIGLAFGHAYFVIDAIAPGSFHFAEARGRQLPDESRRHLLLTYLSFVTLTTMGAEITPASETARALVVVEAILGQFYLAVLIGELVGKRLAQATRSNVQK